MIPTFAALAGCGSGQDDPGGKYYYDMDSGEARLMGVEGVSWATTSYETRDNKTTIIDHDGVTDDAGQFLMGVSRRQECNSTTDDKGNAETKCYDVGPPHYGAFNFSVCGRALPQVYGPTTDTGWRPPTYTISDLSPDPTVVRNVAAVLLMANANSGDPTKTGIKISSSLQQGQCDRIDWAAIDIQQEAASWQAVAQRDGKAHPWPSQEAITDYLQKTYVCAQSGYHFGLQRDSATPTLFGQFIVVVDTQGQVQGMMDYSGRGVIEPFHEGRWFNGQLTYAAGGSTFSSVIPADTPTPGMPEMQVSVSFAPEKPQGSWQTATSAGTTRATVLGYYDEDTFYDRGLTAYAYQDFPKYRFMATNVTYTRPGGTAPETFILELEVNHDNEVSGGLRFWPPKRYDEEYDYHANALNWHGTMKGNTIDMEWYDNAKVKATKARIQLTVDPQTATATGTIPGIDGGEFITFAPERPLCGCWQ